MNNFDHIKLLRREAEKCRTIWRKYTETINNPRHNCDKHAFCLNGDTRFAVFSEKVTLCAYTGYYGNSICSTFMQMDSSMVGPALIRVLGRQLPQLLQDIAAELEKEAASKLSAAQEEVTAMQNALDEIANPNEPSKGETP